ncbi:MAG: hypothetical protein JWQ87_5463 [Candidatus Sulfotelmatobacter sp.]|nr:hypothetical protein [Candidatus Sulfotelmatobacter sp.]
MRKIFALLPVLVASFCSAQIINPSGGTGTVGSCGAAGNAYYSASGTSITCDTSITDNGSGTLTATTFSGNATGLTGTPNLTIGTLNESGALTLSGAAGAATTISTSTTNASISILPNGTGPVIFNVGTATNPTLQATGSASNTGAMFTTTAFMWTATGTGVASLNNLGATVSNNKVLGFSSTATANGSLDTGLSRTAANVVAVGNGTAADESALLRSGSTCRITADVSLTVNTPNSFCSFNLPAVAKAWAFQCNILWAITAGSGTNTFAVGVNAAQTPTGATNALAVVTTTTTGTLTNGSAAISASGATNILTGATYTPAATVLPASISGTILASATAGTFAITAAANGTTATASVKAGSFCTAQ